MVMPPSCPLSCPLSCPSQRVPVVISVVVPVVVPVVVSVVVPIVVSVVVPIGVPVVIPVASCDCCLARRCVRRCARRFAPRNERARRQDAPRLRCRRWPVSVACIASCQAALSGVWGPSGISNRCVTHCRASAGAVVAAVGARVCWAWGGCLCVVCVVFVGAPQLHRQHRNVECACTSWVGWSSAQCQMYTYRIL